MKRIRLVSYIEKDKVCPEFNPIKDLYIKNKRGCEIGNLRFLGPKEKYKEYRNMLAKALNIKHCLFGNVIKKIDYIVITEKGKTRKMNV